MKVCRPTPFLSSFGKYHSNHLMKHFLLIFFLTFFLDAGAQYPKLIVALKDKGGNTYSFDDPSKYLSQRAVERRTRYHIPIDSTDIPVSSRYLDSIRSAGKVTILSTSKWLNQVLIETTDQDAIKKIRSFPFVKSTAGVGYRAANNNRRERENESVKPLNTLANRPAGTTGNLLDYGSNYNQIHIHEGEFLHNKGFRGETMQIAVLDAGFLEYKRITAFDSIRMNQQVLGERDFVSFDNSVNEDDSHGMYCLSTLCANWPGRMVGTAPKANYWLIRTENAASEYPIEEHNWVAGAEFADSTGSDMISSSLGYYDFDDASFNHSYNDFYKNTTMVSKGAALAAKKGMIVMNSAGNEGGNNWNYLIFPADADSVCAVGAVNTSGVIAGFSSQGYAGKTKPNIVSVGAGTVIAGLNNQPSSGNGTSFSNPNVAGLIACLWQAFPAANNMKILDAVYKSADRYDNPDNRYGFGIPNFKTAYRLLKHEENVATYGNVWLFATPNPFTSTIDVRLIGQTDGQVTISISNTSGQVVAEKTLESEKEEVFNFTFFALANLPAGFYTLKYTDGLTTRNITLQKGNIFQKDWLVALPVPFTTTLSVFLKAPETGEISLRLIDAKGSTVDNVTIQVTENETRSVSFKNVPQLTRGVYFVQYISKTQKKVVRILKV